MQTYSTCSSGMWVFSQEEVAHCQVFTDTKQTHVGHFIFTPAAFKLLLTSTLKSIYDECVIAKKSNKVSVIIRI